MCTWLENIITFSDGVLRRRDHSRSTRQSELHRFYTFIARNNTKNKTKVKRLGLRPKPHPKWCWPGVVELSPAGPPEADQIFFFYGPVRQGCREVPWFLTLDNHQP